MDPKQLECLKRLIREGDVPYFSEEELQAYFQDNGEDLKATAYRCLIIKAEDTTLSLPGMTTGNTSKYYLRLAAQFRPTNSGQLGGAF